MDFLFDFSFYVHRLLVKIASNPKERSGLGTFRDFQSKTARSKLQNGISAILQMHPASRAKQWLCVREIVKTLRIWILGRFPFVRTSGLDHCRTSQLANEIGFFQGFLLKNHLLLAHYLGFDWSGWRVLINSEILITTGMVWLVSSDKWKAPLVSLSIVP